MASDYHDTLTHLEVALQVLHIATRPLITIGGDASPAAARQLAEKHHVNHLPVRDPGGAVIGVLENVNGEIADRPRPREDVGAVRLAMAPMTDDVLVEGQRSLDGVLGDLLDPPYYQLVVMAGRIDAMVTASDLNKAPVAVLAYAMIARLETAMSAAIRTLTRGDDDAAVDTLSAGGPGQVRANHHRLREGDLDARLLDATTFKQKGIILARLGGFGDVRPAVVEDEFEALYDRVRNPVMHMTPFVGESIADLRRFADDLALVRRRTGEAMATASPAERR